MSNRAQFEAWVMRINPNADLSIMVDGIDKGEYVDGYHAGLFAAWQASRSAIVVDIASHTEFEIEHMISPEKDGYSTGWIDGRNYAASQVRAAGITVKGDSDDSPT